MGSSPTPGIVNPTTLPATLANLLSVAAGGAIGATLRYGVGELARRIPALAGFPWATLAINVAGSLVIGWFLRWSELHDASMPLRAFVAVGICGGFTTFSTFASENAALLYGGQPLKALLHAVASVVLSVAAIFAGYALARP